MAGRVREDQAVFDVLVRMEHNILKDAETLGDTLVSTPSGGTIPLKNLASISMDRGPSAISRENGQRKMVVTCNLGDRDLFNVVTDIRTRLEAQVPMPQGYHVEYGGQFESGESAARNLLLMGIGAIVAVFGLLFMAFKSTKDATLIMLNLPLAWMGGVVGVYFSGGILSVATLIGFITLFGIATRNGIMLVSHIHHLMDKEGVANLKEAVRRAAMERLAPILMTALTAGLALVPIILRRHEPGSEIQAPMASVILFGLLSSTALNMLVVPSLYLRFGARVRRREENGDAQVID